MAFIRMFAVTVLAASTMAGVAWAESPQPGVLRPDTAQLRPAADPYGDCDLRPMLVHSDDSLFGADRADGLR